MGWADITSKQAVTFENLYDACYYGYLLQLLDMPPAGVSPKKCIRAELIQSYVEIEPAPLAGTPSSQIVTKEKIVGKQYVYYQIQGCDPADGTYWTRHNPIVASRRYYLPSYPNPKIYYYTGAYTPLQTNIPGGYNGSIQISSLYPYETGCPTP
jgi:hypothetical protein